MVPAQRVCTFCSPCKFVQGMYMHNLAVVCIQVVALLQAIVLAIALRLAVGVCRTDTW